MTQPRVVIVAGPNGAGKSTTASVLLSEDVQFTNYINPDLIARGLAPLDPASVSFAAGRIVHNRIQELIEQRENFAFETTLSGRSYMRTLKQLAEKGYIIDMLFLWLTSADLAVQRVAERVREGGHNIPEDVIRRRYGLGVRNFFTLYEGLVDNWRFIDNSLRRGPEIIAAKESKTLRVLKPEIWNELTHYAEGFS